MKNTPNKIILDDLSSGLYKIHIDRKNHRICKVLRTLVLRDDFIHFLERLEKEAPQEELESIKDEKKLKLWQVNFDVCSNLTRNYLNNVTKSDYFKNKDEEWVKNFLGIAETIIRYSYLDGYTNSKNKNTIFNKMVVFDDRLNYPNIKQHVYDKEIFWKVFKDAFFVNFKEAKEKSIKNNTDKKNINKFEEVLSRDKFALTNEPKVCQIVFDDTTEKEELIDYIEKSWGLIEESLRISKTKIEEERITNPANFLRDIEIYNRYQLYKDEGFKNPDVEVSLWLKDESEYKTEIEPETIKKIVTLLKTELKDLNTEKIHVCP